MLKQIIVGAFGKVFVCVHKQSHQLRAVKILNKSEMKEDDRLKLINEVQILSTLVSLSNTANFVF